MKKMKKLNLNKMRIVSLRNLHTVRGGNTVANTCISQATTGIHTDECPTTSIEPTNCESSGRTDTLEGGTFSAAPIETEYCSAVLTVCVIQDL
jgi:natural product precursor